MSFTPIVMRSPDGRECRVGSALEREQLINRGYEVVKSPATETAKPSTDTAKDTAAASKSAAQASK
ncbi:hypothetical protein [Prescottella agglutinans]|uniref:Uncharacterized protein n=1 Tax=Prescottella agglutinans TaxID=1644129 RepID=A0ABT6MEV2_9NOCA|nr:hypothetical protein [Prescottella agglutinans]MDH6282802.1 hypothetical protein [Prescottella agglutinans]